MELDDEEGNLQSSLLPRDDDDSQDKHPPAPEKRSIHSHYGHGIGVPLTLSLAASTGFIVYAHLGLSAVILTNQKNPMGNANQPNIFLSTHSVGACQNVDLNAIHEWYTIYNLTYPRSIRDAWNGGAKLLSVIIVLFSGIWPYLKNVTLLLVWYMPLTTERQAAVLHWLSLLSKYTLVDVFAVMGVVVGTQLQLEILIVELVARAEPRFGIVSFLVATVWVCLQIELTKELHERASAGHVERGPERERGGDGSPRRPMLKFPPACLLVVSVLLYTWGAMSEIVAITTNGCEKSYNLVTLANAVVDEHGMAGNSAAVLTWTLYLSYVVLVLAIPMLAHVLQAFVLLSWLPSRKKKAFFKWASAVRNFACVEVLLIGIFALEYKYPELVKKIGGDLSANFLHTDSKLGLGFYVLIGYSVVSNLLQCLLRLRLNSMLPDRTATEVSDHK